MAHDFNASYKAHYGLSTDISDTVVDEVLAQVERAIRRRTGIRLVNTATVTEVHDGDGKTGYFYTRQRPIQSITSIHEDIDTPRAYDANSLVDSDYYSFDADTGKVYKLGSLSSGSTWIEGHDAIQIIYKPGYATVAAVDDDIVAALFMWARHLQLRSDRKREGIRSVNAGDGSVSYDITGIPAVVSEILDPLTPVWMGTGYGL